MIFYKLLCEKKIFLNSKLLCRRIDVMMCTCSYMSCFSFSFSVSFVNCSVSIMIVSDCPCVVLQYYCLLSCSCTIFHLTQHRTHL